MYIQPSLPVYCRALQTLPQQAPSVVLLSAIATLDPEQGPWCCCHVNSAPNRHTAQMPVPVIGLQHHHLCNARAFLVLGVRSTSHSFQFAAMLWNYRMRQHGLLVYDLS